MAEYISFNKNVEINLQTVLSFVNSLKTGQELRKSILLKHGIDIKNGEWFLQQKWLDAFREIGNDLGEINLFLIGAAIIDNASFPPINNLEEALRLLDVAYHMNHRLNDTIMFDETTGEIMEGIGNYKLVEYSADEKNAVIVCNNPVSYTHLTLPTTSRV